MSEPQSGLRLGLGPGVFAERPEWEERKELTTRAYIRTRCLLRAREGLTAHNAPGRVAIPPHAGHHSG